MATIGYEKLCTCGHQARVEERVGNWYAQFCEFCGRSIEWDHRFPDKVSKDGGRGTFHVRYLSGMGSMFGAPKTINRRNRMERRAQARLQKRPGSSRRSAKTVESIQPLGNGRWVYHLSGRNPVAPKVVCVGPQKKVRRIFDGVQNGIDPRASLVIRQAVKRFKSATAKPQFRFARQWQTMPQDQGDGDDWLLPF